MAEFECTRSGRFKDSTDDNCGSYYYCSMYNGSFVTAKYTCPSGTYFSPALHRCTINYFCESATITSPTTTTTLPTTISQTATEAERKGVQQNFACITVGRYANVNDDSCKSYYLCSRLSNGSFIETAYQCPHNFIFDQSICKCSSLQDCRSLQLQRNTVSVGEVS